MPTVTCLHKVSSGVKESAFLTIKQMLTALLQQAAHVEWDEQLGSKGVPIQVTGQSKGALQDRDQQEPTGRGFAVPALNLRRNSNNESYTHAS